ncbi:MAG: carbohydrate binding family 9 domain-containing protein, partial [Gemmatimonadetes bacterium]|nr:carbohydrate binding family 9 domain-containing protein [Gemmatimonadota bacterium]
MTPSWQTLLSTLGASSLLVISAASAQIAPEARSRPLPPPARYEVSAANSEMRVDGLLNEAAWRAATPMPLEYEWTPGDNSPPPVESRCYVTYDEDNLYVGCRAADPEPTAIRAHLADRDATATLAFDDHFVFLLDPFNDQRRGFQFRVNARGVQADALFSTAEGIEDFSWDAIWDSAARITEGGYEVEVAIPFRSLRFPRTSEVQTWGFIAERSYPRSVRHRIQSAPRDLNNPCLLCQANKLTGFEGIAPSRNVELAPTLTSSRTDGRDPFPVGRLTAGGLDTEAGLDARWGITPNLSLNAAVNPDFSQVEADVAQLDVNTRFALFFPEKRPFFLESADVFTTPINAVFTRTVADPLAGVKLTGKVAASAIGLFAARDRITNLIFPANQG